MSTTSPLLKNRKPKFFLRFTLWFIGVLLALAIILPIATVVFFDPNDYRPQISKFLTEKTGVPIEIQGNIKLKLFPWIGLKVENTSLAQAPEFGKGKFLQVKEIDFQFPIRQLLQRHLQIETLKLKGVSLNFIKKSNGKTNADYFISQDKPSPEATPNGTQTSTPSSKKLTFHIANIDIQDAKVRYVDQEKNQKIMLSNIQLQVENPKHLEYFPLKTQFDFVILTKGSAALTGNANASGSVTPNKDNYSANLQTALSIKQDDSVWKDAKIKATLSANPKTILVKNIDVKALNTQISGNCQIPMDKKAPIHFQLNMNALNLDALEQSTKTTPPSKVTIQKTSSPSSNAPSAETSLARSVKGEITIGQLRVKNLSLTHVKTTLYYDHERIKLNPLVADLYDGKLNIQVTHLLNSAPTSFQGKITNIQLQPLLQDLGHEIPLTGRGDFDFAMVQTDKIPEGNVKCHIQNGMITGVDVKYYLNKVQSMIKKEKLTLPDTKQTPFSSLTATLFTHDNSIDNNDLLILSPDFRVNGVGSIDLNTDTLAYKLQAWRQYPDGTEHPNAYPLALRLKGSLQHPRVEPDFDLYLKTVFEKEMKDRLNINKHLERGIDKLLGGQKSSNDDNANNSEEKSHSPEDKLKEKLENEVGKGIKKLFKIH